MCGDDANWRATWADESVGPREAPKLPPGEAVLRWGWVRGDESRVPTSAPSVRLHDDGAWMPMVDAETDERVTWADASVYPRETLPDGAVVATIRSWEVWGDASLVPNSPLKIAGVDSGLIRLDGLLGSSWRSDGETASVNPWERPCWRFPKRLHSRSILRSILSGEWDVLRVTQFVGTTCRIISRIPENSPPQRINGFAVSEEESVGLECAAPKLQL